MGPEVGRIGGRWNELTAAFRASRPAILTELGRLVAAYAAPSRHYHDLKHIDALLTLSRAHRAALRDPVAVDLAIFYHDAVYEPAAKDNEAASAALARTALTALGAEPDIIEKVTLYIEATRHIGDADIVALHPDSDLDYLLDFDLSILAAEPEIYDAYAAAIRREYAIYPDEAYRPGRAGVLSKLLALPTLYRVPELANTWEPRARSNLAHELASLGAR